MAHNNQQGKKKPEKAPVIVRALDLHDRLLNQPQRPGSGVRLDRVVEIIYKNAPGN